MIPMIAPPKPDELVEALFVQVLHPPEGYHFYLPNGQRQALYPVFGQDKWRLLLQKGDILVPVFLEGKFIVTLGKALHAMQRELNAAVDNLPENHATN
jgi:hypothetical protein